jgi:hypothetical protein
MTMMRKFAGTLTAKGRVAAFVLVGAGMAAAGLAVAPAQAAVAHARPGAVSTGSAMVGPSTAPRGHLPKSGTTGTPAVHRVKPGTRVALPRGLRPTRTVVPAYPKAKRSQMSAATPTVTGWSGYAQTGGTYTSVSATWTVPSVSSTGSTSSYAATWVGIDGYSNTDLIQTGVEEEWDGSTNSAVYLAWWEILPNGQNYVFDVSAGDVIYASVSEVSSGTWQIFLYDRTNGDLLDQDESYSGPQSSAEFIQEDPGAQNCPMGGAFCGGTGGVGYSPLADFSEVTFTNARVNGQSPDLGSDNDIPMYQGTYLAEPSAPSQAGNSFNVTYGSTVPAAPATPLVFLRHTDGSVYTCYAGACPGWESLDINPATTTISAGAGTVFELHSNGQIWEWSGQGCSPGVCEGWIELDDNAAATAIAAGAGTVFELHSDGSVWRSTGQACDGSSCPGWTELDSGQGIVKISAGGSSLYALSSSGIIYQWTASTGWNQIADNAAVTQIVATASTVYALAAGEVYQYDGSSTWTGISYNTNIIQLAANSTEVWELYNDGEIWQYEGNKEWSQIGGSGSGDDDITADASTVYTVTSAGKVWQFQPSSDDWLQIDYYYEDVQLSGLNGG